MLTGDSITCFGLRKPAPFRNPPAGPLPGEISASRSNGLEKWTPYPYNRFARPIYMQDLYNTSVELWKIGVDVVTHLDQNYHDLTTLPNLSDAEDYYSRLLDWSQSIPSSTRIQELSPPFALASQSVEIHSDSTAIINSVVSVRLAAAQISC